MALLATVRDSFGASPRYIYIRDYRLDRATGAVTGRVEVYKDRATRQAYKAADAALIPLAAQIAARPDNAESLKQQQAQQMEAFAAAQPGLSQDFHIPPGEVTIADNGAVTLAALYAWLAANSFTGAVDA